MELRKKIIQRLNLKNSGHKGWLINDSLTCPYCGKRGKLGFFIGRKGGVIHHFKCGIKKNLKNYLKDVGIEDIEFEENYQSIDNSLLNFHKERELKLDEISLPIGYERITMIIFNNEDFYCVNTIGIKLG